MKLRILSLLSAGVLGLGLVGCGDTYKCDDKEYAKQALNLALFNDTQGDKNITLEKLGFKPGDITLIKLDKDSKSSVCKAVFTNTFTEKFIENSKDRNVDKLKAQIANDSKAKERVEGFTLLTYDALGAYLMNDFYNALYKNDEEIGIGDAQLLYAISLVSIVLQQKGLVYKVSDNGNGQALIEVDPKQFKIK